MTEYAYDFETYLDMFSAGFQDMETDKRWEFEISDRLDQTREFVDFIYYLHDSKSRGIGFNNEGFDYTVAHFIVTMFEARGYVTCREIYHKVQAIFQDGHFEHMIWPNDRMFTQVDLYKIHHFDNKAKRTSLKKLEINMRSVNVIDLPYDPAARLTDAEKDEVKRYMWHDIPETAKFARLSREKIQFRDDLAAKYPDMGDNVVNFNDTKIGKRFFESKLESRTPGICYHRVNGRREPRQTRRDRIAIGEVISPIVGFTNHPEFQNVLDYLRSATIYELRGGFGDLSATIDGFSFHFGAGGLHGSLNKAIVRADDEYDIIDVDVASFYPNLAIANRFYPEHLGETFCDIYAEVYEMRKSYPKKTAENAMLKLALNGVYGDSNNDYSAFHDPKYTMSITINGQLMLAMLADWLLKPGVSMIQANTDGLTLRVHKSLRDWFMAVCAWWEKTTSLELEYADYSAMFIRDVNNYIAQKTDGSLKRIGDYAHKTVLEDPYTRERQWHSNQDCLVVPKAAEAALVHGADITKFIMAHDDPFDFMLSIKVQRNHSLQLEPIEAGEEPEKIQNITRYYVSTAGRNMTKVMPPLAKTPGRWRHNAVQAGWQVKVVNDATLFDWRDVNWLYYINEAKKLVDCLEERN